MSAEQDGRLGAMGATSAGATSFVGAMSAVGATSAAGGFTRQDFSGERALLALLALGALLAPESV